MKLAADLTEIILQGVLCFLSFSSYWNRFELYSVFVVPVELQTEQANTNVVELTRNMHD